MRPQRSAPKPVIAAALGSESVLINLFHSEKNFIISGVCLSGVCLVRSLSFRSLSRHHKYRLSDSMDYLKLAIAGVSWSLESSSYSTVYVGPIAY